MHLMRLHTPRHSGSRSIGTDGRDRRNAQSGRRDLAGFRGQWPVLRSAVAGFNDSLSILLRPAGHGIDFTVRQRHPPDTQSCRFGPARPPPAGPLLWNFGTACDVLLSDGYWAPSTCASCPAPPGTGPSFGRRANQVNRYPLASTFPRNPRATRQHTSPWPRPMPGLHGGHDRLQGPRIMGIAGEHFV
jgi:hypothetical protein